MASADYDIVGSYNNQRVSSIDSERTVNMFEYIDPLGKKPKTLINTSGLINTEIQFGLSTMGFRRQFVFNNIEYSVVGADIYRTTTNGVTSPIGSFANTDSGFVGIDANTFQIIFVDGQDGYIWDTNLNVFTQITDPAFPATPLDVTYLDGFFVVTDGGTNGFQLSSFNQGLIWGPGSNTFTLAGTSSSITLTSGSNANYQIGTPVVFSGGSLPAELVAGTTYYVVALSGTSIIRVSATPGGAVITSASGGSGTVDNLGQLQQGFMTSHPGTIVACRTLHRRLFLFSQFYTEVWENAGIGTNLPFRRNNSLLMEYGTPAVGSIAVGFDKMYFLSQDRDGLGAVMQVTGSQSMSVSNRALDFQLAQYAAVQQVSDCTSFLIKENGLIFYRMNFTAANHTFVYNVTLSNPESEEGKLWHEEETLEGDRHPAQTHAYFNGINYVGDYANPILYQVDSNTFTNAGEAIRRMRITRPIVPAGYQRRRIDRLQIDLLQGNVAEIDADFVNPFLLTESLLIITTENNVNLLVEPAVNINAHISPIVPFVYLSISRDGGQTYGYTIKAPMGKIGNRTARTLWRKLGTTKRGQAFVTKFEFFDPVPFIIMGASWDSEVLPE
jgi:hypothetical protein